MAELETDIEQECVDIALEAKFISLKVDTLKRSWPDRLFLGPNGKHFFVEFKCPDEIPRKFQDFTIMHLRNMGYQVEVCDSVDDFRLILDRINNSLH